MLRASLHKLGDDRWWLLVLVHHAASDGWSWQVLRRELQACLGRRAAAAAGGVVLGLRALAGDGDRGDRLAALTAYWAAQLEGLPPLLELPIEFSRPSLQTYRGQWVSSVLPPSMAGELRDLGRGRGATMFMTLLAGWTCLLGRYSGSSDICVGTPIGRPRQSGVRKLDRLVHEYARAANAIGRRTDIRMRRSTACAIPAWRVGPRPAVRASAEAALPPERSRPIRRSIQVYFQLRNFPRAATSAVVPVTEVELDTEVGDAADLNLEITETAAGLDAGWQYNTALFTERFARAMLDTFRSAAAGAVAAPDTACGGCRSWTPRSARPSSVAAVTAAAAAGEATVVELFEQQAATARRDRDPVSRPPRLPTAS